MILSFKCYTVIYDAWKNRTGKFGFTGVTFQTACPAGSFIT